MSIYNPNASYQLSKERPTLHVITVGSNITSLATQIPVTVQAQFPVKEIVLKLAYNLNSTGPGLWYLYSNAPYLEADIAGSMGNFSIMKGAEHVYSNDLGNNVMKYTLRQPLNCSGTYYVQIKQVYGSTLTSCDFILDMEFLG